MKYPKSLISGCGLLLTTLLVLSAVFPAAVQAQTQDYWIGGTGDFNVAASWSTGVVPGSGYAADVTEGSNNVCEVFSSDPSFTLNGIRDGVTNNGAMVQSGSTITLGSTQSGWLRMGVNAGEVGYYTIESNAVLNTTFGLSVGEAGSGVLNVYGGTINLGSGGDFSVNGGGFASAGSPASGAYGIVNQTNGIVYGSCQLWVGQSANGQNGVYNLSGGTLAITNWVALGRSGGTGVMNMTGGAFYAGGNGGEFIVGTGYQGSSSDNGIGTLNLSGGNIYLVNGGQLLVPQTANGQGTLNLSGTGAIYCNQWLTIGRGGPGTLNMTGGMIVKTDGNGDHIDIGAGGDASRTGPGTINQSGGMITNSTSDFWLGEVSDATWNMDGGTNYLANLIINEGSGIASTMSINGGFLSVASISSAQPNQSLSVLNLNGGTIQASGSSTEFINNVSSAYIGTNATTFDSQGYSITIPESLASAGSPDGGLIKIGGGTLTLSGGNSYNGPTVVSNGTLYITTASSGNGPLVAVDGTTLGIVIESANAQILPSSMTMGTASGATLDLNLGSFGNPSAVPISVSGALTLNGTVTLNLSDSTPAVGQFHLITYGSLAGSGRLVLGPLPSGMTGTLSNNAAANSFDLVVTGAGAPYWNGNISDLWDIDTTSNWMDLVTGQPETYRDGESVLFNDNATGATNVDLVAVVHPGGVTLDNNYLTYTLSGTGQIAGSYGLTMEGAGTFIIANSGGNTYTGPTTLDAGMLVVNSLANAGSASSIGASTAAPTNLVLAGGTLDYVGPSVSINRGYISENTNGTVDIQTANNLALGGPVGAISGSGFTKSGVGQLSYTGTGVNAIADVLGYTVAQGTVAFTNATGVQTNDLAGSLYVGVSGSTNAVLDISSNITLNLTASGDAVVGDAGASASTGTWNQQGGAVNCAGGYQIWVGQGTSGIGTFNLSAGTFNLANWLAVGRAGGTGIVNLSGTGVINDTAGSGNLDIGTSGGINGLSGTGVLNQSGGAITNVNQTWLGEGTSGEPASGTWNISGGTALLGETHIGQGGTGTSAINVSGAGAITCTGYVDLSLGSGTIANLNIGSAANPGGSFTATGDLTVGDQGTATINMVTNGGGVLTVHGTIYLSRGSSSAFGTINLNAGTTIIAGYLNNGYGFTYNLTNNPQAFNFNGGTLQAYTGSSYFIQPYVNAIVQAGGAIINDGGYNITILADLLNGGGGGGMTKLGNGTLTMNTVNTYTGTTLVGAGILTGTAAFAGPVTVASGAILAPGNPLGTMSIYNNLVLSNGSTTFMALSLNQGNSLVAGLSNVVYGGTLVVTNISSSPLANGNVYQLFSSATPGSGNFSQVVVVPPGNGAATFAPATGELTFYSQVAPTINTPVLSNGNLILTGAGTPYGQYVLLSTTNLTPPVTWTTNTTGTLSSSGTFSNAIPINLSEPARYFWLQTP